MDTEPIKNQFQNNFPRKLSIFHELCKRFCQNPLAGGRATNILDSWSILTWASSFKILIFFINFCNFSLSKMHKLYFFGEKSRENRCDMSHELLILRKSGRLTWGHQRVKSENYSFAWSQTFLIDLAYFKLIY